MYGKSTEAAIAAMSLLAERWDDEEPRQSAAQIAEARGLQPAFVAKVLTVLSQAGLVIGSRGPGGGFVLARPPKRIKIYDVFCLFERESEAGECPFGGGICGVGENCPLHDKLARVDEAMHEVMHETTFEVFRASPPVTKTRRKTTRKTRRR